MSLSFHEPYEPKKVSFQNDQQTNIIEPVVMFSSVADLIPNKLSINHTKLARSISIQQ